MQFIADGPDVPSEVIAAQRDGNLLLFCGAGISVPAGLPTFPQLVERVAAQLGESLADQQEEEFRAGQFDRILGRFERRYPRFLRSIVRQHLTASSDADVSAHRALRSLASHHLHGIRLVTTNFDDLFHRVARPSDPPLASAPALPVPKPGRWRGIVHLHGRIQPSDPECQHLVLTSSDFGVAYLTEAWASRFVREAFNHFVVLFIGYAVNDPVMRYLVDALAAEREHDDRVQQAFALAPAPTDAFDQARQEWSDKRISPILYPEDSTHSKLHETLVAWAQMWELGDQSRRTIVRAHAGFDPRTLGPEQLSQIFWAVGDDGGIGADEFANLGAAAHLSWRDIFEERGLLAAPSREHRRPAALVDAGSSTYYVAGLAPSTQNLGRWLAHHLASPELIRWAVKQGSALHPQFRDMIDVRLSDEQIPPALRRVWRVLLDAPISHRNAYDVRDPLPSLRTRITSEPWGPSLRAMFLRLLTPQLTLDPPFSVERWDRAQPPDVSDLLSGDCKLLGGHSLSTFLQRARARADWSTIAADLAVDLVGKLRSSLDLLAGVDKASEDYDSSYIDRRSLGIGGNEYDVDDWTVLIDLLIECFVASLASNSRHASVVAEMCTMGPYPIFRRLALHFGSRSPWPAAITIADRLTTDSDRWLWSLHVQRELYASLPALWTKLDSGTRDALSSQVLAGPSREFFHPDVNEEERTTFTDRMIFDRLNLLVQQGPGLNAAAKDRLASLRSTNPDWTSSDHTFAEANIGSQMIFESGVSAEDALLAMPLEEVVALLAGDRSARYDLMQHWYAAAGREPQWALWVLAMLHARGHLSSEIWSSGLHGITRTVDIAVVTEVALTVPHFLPDSELRSMTRQLAYLLDSISRDLAEGRRLAFLRTWDRVRQVARQDAAEEQDDIHFAAINHSLGILTESLLNLVRSEQRPRDGGIPDDVRDRLALLASEKLPSGRLARVAIASRIQWLHDLDAAWTCATLAPFLDWSHPAEARAMWCGVAHTGRIRPSLFAALKASFLSAFQSFADFDRRTQSLIANLLVSYALESPNALTTGEVTRALTLLDDDHRAAVAWTLGRKLKDAGDGAADLWLSRLGPWITGTWPKAQEALGVLAADRLAELALLTGSAFPQAVTSIAPFLVPLNNPHDVAALVHDLCENSFAQRFPDAALVLIDAITPIDMGIVDNLGRGLDIILEADPLLAGTPRVRRLRDNAAAR